MHIILFWDLWILVYTLKYADTPCDYIHVYTKIHLAFVFDRWGQIYTINIQNKTTQQ